MKRGNVGVLIGLLVFGAIMLFGTSANALCPADCELFWEPVTTYTDGTSIEAQDLPISYVVEWDGVLLPPTVNTAVPVPKPYGHDVVHSTRIKAVTARGTEGAFSAPPFVWSSPVGIPEAVGPGIGVR